MSKFLAIAIGGALGAIARYLVGVAVAQRLGSRFPYGTLVINLSACVIIGIFATWLTRRTDLSPLWRFLIPTGFIGAYSTFSTFELETLSLLQNGSFMPASIYVLGSLVLGLAATWFGVLLGRTLP